MFSIMAVFAQIEKNGSELRDVRARDIERVTVTGAARYSFLPQYAIFRKSAARPPDCNPSLFIIWLGSGMIVYDWVWPSFMTLIVAAPADRLT
jgi:hypothetical protein